MSLTAHFIGGPWHGEDRAISAADPLIKGIEPVTVYWDNTPTDRLAGAPWKEFEYRRLPTSLRPDGYVLYTYVQPKQRVKIEIEVEINPDKFSSGQVVDLLTAACDLNNVDVKKCRRV